MLGEGNSRDRDLLIHFDILRKVFGGVLRPANEQDLVDHCTTTVFRVGTAAQTEDAYAHVCTQRNELENECAQSSDE